MIFVLVSSKNSYVNVPILNFAHPGFCYFVISRFKHMKVN